MSTALIPALKWAENADQIFLTIEVPSSAKSTLDMTEDTLKYSAVEGTKTWSLDMKFLKKIDSSTSTWAAKARNVEVLIKKTEETKGWWNQLLADKNAYKGRVKIDWDLWHDEDEEKEMPNQFGQGGMGGGGFPGMGGMGGMPGMPGGMGGMNNMDFSSMMGGGNDDEPDSDDDGLPDLEASDKKPAEEEPKKE